MEDINGATAPPCDIRYERKDTGLNGVCQFLKIIESLRLEKPSKITKSYYQPIPHHANENTSLSATPPGMVIPPLPRAAYPNT